MDNYRHGSQIWLQLSAASPTNKPQPKAMIAILLIKVVRLKLWPAAGCKAKRHNFRIPYTPDPTVLGLGLGLRLGLGLGLRLGLGIRVSVRVRVVRRVF